MIWLVHLKYYFRKIKFRMKKNNIIRVIFCVSQNQLWCCQSLYDELEKDNNFEVRIIALPNWEDKTHNLIESGNANYDFFLKRKMNVVKGFDINGNIIDLCGVATEIMFVDQPATIDYLEMNGIPIEKIVDAFFLSYIPYGYKVANGGISHFGLPLHNYSWKVFAESNWHKQQFYKLGKMKAKNVVTSGFPKLDIYNNEECTNDVWKNSVPNRKRVIWAPHWSFGDADLAFSTFDKYYMYFYDFAKEHNEIEWILKPHQRVYTWAVQTGLMSKTEVDEYFDKWDKLPNAHVYNEGNYMDIFRTSDALITDCGSFLAEYLPSKKPIIHLYRPEAEYNEVGYKLINTYYRCTTFTDIERIIKQVIIMEDDYKYTEREKIMENVVPNKEGAGRTIMNVIKKELL